MLVTGQKLLHYRLLEKIGEGGMGVVWRVSCGPSSKQLARGEEISR